MRASSSGVHRRRRRGSAPPARGRSRPRSRPRGSPRRAPARGSTRPSFSIWRPGVVEVVLARRPRGRRSRARARARRRRRRGARWPRSAGPVGLAETNSTLTRSAGAAPPPPKPSPAASTQSSAPTYHGSARKRFRKPGPATSTRSSAVAEPIAQRAAQPLGDLARRRLEQRREHERRVGRVVAVVGLLGALERRRGLRRAAVGQPGGRRLDRGAQVADRGHERDSAAGGREEGLEALHRCAGCPSPSRRRRR